MDELREEVEALEQQLHQQPEESALEVLLRRSEATALRLDAVAISADRLANRVRAGVIPNCRERLGLDRD